MEATGDVEFEEEVGLELLVETARLWRSLGYLNTATDQFRIDGVTGPDEYSALADNNVYTNLMAQRNLRWAAGAVQRHPEKARSLGVDDDEVASWREAADKMYIPYDERLQVTPQAENFTEHEVWDFADTKPDQYPLFLHFPYFDLYRKQVCKQADLVLAMLPAQRRVHARAEGAQLRVLRAADRARLLAVGLLAGRPRRRGGPAPTRLRLPGRGGAHRPARPASQRAGRAPHGLAGRVPGRRWSRGSVVCAVQNGSLSFSPRLPDALGRLAFHLLFRGSRLRVEVTATEATYRLLEGSPLKVRHHGEEILLPADKVISRSIPSIKAGPRPAQPPGRAPAPRGERARSTA